MNNDKEQKDKKIDDTLKIASKVLTGLYERDRVVLESPEIINFVEKNFGAFGRAYYDKLKESYLR